MISYERMSLGAAETCGCHWDVFDRSIGYSLNGVRQTTLAYDPATGRLASMRGRGTGVPPVQSDIFAWSYLPGADLKSQLAYPNGLTAAWAYDANSRLTQVRNATASTISQYDYTYDTAGRRVSCAKSGTAMSESRTDTYGYNARSELISSRRAAENAEEYAYSYDPIGNRQSSSDLGESRTYTANNLNQYTGISDGVDTFVPQFDDDGDQTLIQTKTGVWSVTYNGEIKRAQSPSRRRRVTAILRPLRRSGARSGIPRRSGNYYRPVSWSCGETNIAMSFDRMGRRVSYTETVGVTTNAHHTFVYDGYLQIADNSGNRYVWDPTEPVATRPLMWLHGGNTYSYTHDGNKNVSEVVDESGIAVAHYEYAPFGDLTVAAGNLASDNRFRFSSEYADDTLGLVYYNYRHYEPVTGRWMGRDPYTNGTMPQLYFYVRNAPYDFYDIIGLLKVDIGNRIPTDDPMEIRLPFKPEGIKEGCELNFIQITNDLGYQDFVVDAKSCPATMGGVSQPVPPYYYNREEIDRIKGFTGTDGTLIFIDRPTATTQFYLFAVQRCCLKYYDNLNTCDCCRHSKATVLERVAWTTRYNDKVIIQKIKPSDRSAMDSTIKKLVDGKTFHTQCSKYMTDHPEQMSMPTIVDLDFAESKIK